MVRREKEAARFRVDREMGNEIIRLLSLSPPLVDWEMHEIETTNLSLREWFDDAYPYT